MPMPWEQTELNRLIHEAFGDDGEAIIAAYRLDYPKATPFGLYATIAASRLRVPAFAQAARKAELGAAPAYAYVYAWRTPVLDNRPGPFHACEIAFAFDNAEICDHYSAGSPEAFALSRQMSTAWVNFARTGNPNHSGLPHWPAYNTNTPRHHVLRHRVRSAQRSGREGTAVDYPVPSWITQIQGGSHDRNDRKND